MSEDAEWAATVRPWSPIDAGLAPVAPVTPVAARPVAQHGTRSKYVGGCRCADCKAAHASYAARRRAAQKGLVGVSA